MKPITREELEALFPPALATFDVERVLALLDERDALRRELGTFCETISGLRRRMTMPSEAWDELEVAHNRACQASKPQPP